MKKAKKTIAAKAAAPVSEEVLPGAKTLKAEVGEKPDRSAETKALRRPTKISEAAPLSKTKLAAEAKPLTKAEPKAKRKTAAKPTEQPKISAPTTPKIEPEVAATPVVGKKRTVKAKPEPPAEIKAAVEPKTIPESKAVVKPTQAASIQPQEQIKREVTAKPLSKKKRVISRKTAPPTEKVPPPQTTPTAKTLLKVPAEEKSSITEIPRPPHTPATTKAVPPIARAEEKPAPKPARKAPEKIPSILLEGDKPEPAAVSGPGQRYALGPKAPVEKFQTEGELPESYGTGELLLTARDPHWLYAHWDLSHEQQRRYNALSRDGHLIVRVYINEARGNPAVEVHVHPESRHWFVHVDKANTRYVAELGYYSAANKWGVAAASAATLTPPDAVSPDTSAAFATIPFEVPMEKLLSLVKEAVHENAPLAQALQELRAEGHPELPPMSMPPPEHKRADAPAAAQRYSDTSSAPKRPHKNGKAKVIPLASAVPPARWSPSEWTPAQERALAEVISMDEVRRVWMGSLEITELIRRQFMQELAAGEFGVLLPGAPTSPAGPIGTVAAISSPGAKPAQSAKGFWFIVNAELIVYGATEKDATVTIAGRRIKLRPDGSFSYRFALPDGNYEMPVVAISSDQTDGRAAELKFSRSTEYRGDVGVHPPDPLLQPIRAENF